MLSESPIEVDAEMLVRQARAELEERLRAGQACAAEEFRDRHPDLWNDPEAALELIFAEYVLRLELGQHPRREDWYARFPELQNRLERLFRLQDVIAAGPRGDTIHAADTVHAAPETYATPRGEGRPRIGQYEVIEEIGRGGMGVVYKARQTSLNRLVALKMILAGTDAGPQERARFRAEAEAAARLQHPHIVQIHEVGEHDGRPFLSLEYVDGGSLEERLTGTPWSAAESARLVETLARAMHHAHQQGIVHRDLKPANILLTSIVRGPSSVAQDGDAVGVRDGPRTTDHGLAKIADFGLARRLRSQSVGGQSGYEVTAVGAIVGTPGYMAPEQAAGDGQDIGPAADVYALGAILYELLTGRPPFQGAHVLETLEQVRTRDPLPPSRLLPKLARDAETITLKCLQKEPARRYGSALELADDLGRFLRGEPIHARPTPAWERTWKWAKRRPAVAALLSALLVLAVVSLTSVTLLWRQAASALNTVRLKQDETEAALASKALTLAQRDWLANDLDQARRHLDACPAAHRGPEWRRLHRLCHACLLVLGNPDSKEKVTSLAWSPDGRLLASNLSHHTAKIWDAETGRERLSMKIEPNGFAKVVFRPDGRLMSLSWPAPRPPNPPPLEVRLWDLKTQRLVREFTAGTPTGRMVLSGDGSRLAMVGFPADTITVVDGDSGATVTTIDGSAVNGGAIVSMALSADGRMLAWAPYSKAVQVHDVVTGAVLGRVSSLRVNFLAFSPDGQRLALVKFDPDKLTGIVEIGDYRTRKVVCTLRGHASILASAAFSADGRRLATGGADKTVMVWDLDTGKELFTFRDHLAPVYAVEFSPDGTRLASGGQEGTVRIWDVRPLDDRTN